MAKTIQVGAVGFAARSLARLGGLPLAQCYELVEPIQQRKPRLTWMPQTGAVLIFFGWLVFGRIDHASDNLFKAIGSILWNYGIAAALALLVGMGLPSLLLRREVRHHLFAPACFWCGYSLRGLVVEDAAIRCPECGCVSPVARQPP